jgi:hypothetical protein
MFMPTVARVAACLLTALTITMEGPAGLHYGPGAAGLLRWYVASTTSRTNFHSFKFAQLDLQVNADGRRGLDTLVGLQAA